MFMMKTSHTFYTVDSRPVFMDSRQIFIKRIANKHVFMVVCVCVCVLFWFILSCPGISEKVKIVRECLSRFSVLLFLEENQLNF